MRNPFAGIYISLVQTNVGTKSVCKLVTKRSNGLGYTVGNVHSPEMLYWFGELALNVMYTRAMNTTHYLTPPHGLCEQARDLQV